MDVKFAKAMLDNAGIEYSLQVPCSKLTTFRTGGPCAILVKVRSTDQLSSVVSLCGRTSTSYKVIGAGSNLLVSDNGYDGIMIKLTGELAGLSSREAGFTAGAGLMLPSLCRKTAEMGLSGLEFAAGIPGTVGGAVWMNAGAWGSEIVNMISSVTIYNPSTDEILTRSGPFTADYRKGPFYGTDAVIIAARFGLVVSDRKTVETRMKDLEKKRKDTQPVGKPSAGSVFRNPEKANAGELIESCGLRNERINGAVVSDKHANFILNDGGASSADIYALVQLVREAVLQKIGTELVPEIEFIGEF
jgi:UDP-N-acetylmuramate dehydrogenase